jgi:16S rRNA (uracil1498-N3)-methyltransferase
VLSVAPGRIEFQLGDDVPQPQAQQVTIFLSIFKFDRMEWAIEKATELGVTDIYPLAAARSDPRLIAAAGKRVERWRRLALQASQQARRAAPPLIEPPQTLHQALGQTFDLSLVLAETERVTSLRQALRPATPASHIALALGPEGGWTSDELAEFTRAGWQPVSLGPGILRAETAAIAALAVVMAEVHDLSSR